MPVFPTPELDMGSLTTMVTIVSGALITARRTLGKKNAGASKTSKIESSSQVNETLDPHDIPFAKTNGR